MIAGFKRIDRYILTEWLKILAVMLGVTMGLLFLEDMYGNFGDLIHYRATLQEILLYYAVLAPSFLPVVLPLSLLLSLLYCLGQFHRNNELVALRSCGYSLFRLTWTIWAVGLLFSGLLLYLNAKVVPWSVEQSRQVWENLEFSHEASVLEGEKVGLVNNLAFDHTAEGRLWFMNRFSEFTYRGFGVTVSELDEERREARRVMAREAYYDELDRSWVFLEGREIVFDVETRDTIRSRPFDRMVLESFSESPRFMLLFSKRPKDLSFLELRQVLGFFSDQDNPNRNIYAVHYHSILAGTLSCLIVVGISIPFSITGVRVNPTIGVFKSVGLFLVYFLLENMVRLFGEREIVDPAFSAWFPNLLMLAIAVWLFRRAN